jgi:DNA-binding MarR family transcriptional regulator
MRDKEEHSGGRAAEITDRHREILEAAALQMGTVAPRFFRAVKGRIAQNMELPEDMREMGESQIRVLQTLMLGRHRTSDLARQFHVTNPTISRIVDSLVDRGYVKRNYDPDDRRCIYLELTGQGQEAGEQVRGHFFEAVMEFLRPLSEEQLEDIVRAFKHLESLVPQASVEESEVSAQEGGHRHGGYHGPHAASRIARMAMRETQREVRRQMRDVQRAAKRETRGT